MDCLSVESPIPLSPDRTEAQSAPGRQSMTPVPIIEIMPDTEDIYRGSAPPRSPPPRQPSPVPSSAPSSSGWSGLGLRRGTLGAVLERAINRWARARSGSSASSSSSSSSSLSSVHTRKLRFRRRRPSASTSVITQSDHFVRARRRAIEAGRVLPRDFTLVLPDSLIDERKDTTLDRPSSTIGKDLRVFRPGSLPSLLQRLDLAIKRSSKLRRPGLFKSLSPLRALEADRTPHKKEYVAGFDAKGKLPETIPVQVKKQATIPEKPQTHPAWWLDVASPSWNDMREIGKLLHLHPLTLEDILHQETREKVELFPRLGYYFVVFRALESDLTRAKTTQLSLALDDDTVPEGIVGATNVYIVVFRDGICTFHFEDISNHTRRVQQRIMQLEETLQMSSDWLVHGILDSIVDQYFPLLKKIEEEAKVFDDLILSMDVPIRDRHAVLKPSSPAKDLPPDDANEKKIMPEVDKEKLPSSTDTSIVKPTEGSGSQPFILSYPRIFSKLATLLGRRLAVKRDAPRSTESSPLMHIASTRRLVTSLSRLLGAKSEVISQMRKHLGSNTTIGSGWPARTFAMDVGIYLDDIQDHILLLHQSLAHYESVLSNFQADYLLRSRAVMKPQISPAMLIFPTLIVSISATQIIIGVCSLNVRLPTNQHIPSAPLNAWVIVVAMVLLTMAVISGFSRYWYLQAKRKYARGSRGF